MQFRKNGIPIDVPDQRPKVVTKTFKGHEDFYKYKKYATLTGFEDGCKVIATAPIEHPEFKKLLDKGYRVIETWKRSDIA